MLDEPRWMADFQAQPYWPEPVFRPTALSFGHLEPLNSLTLPCRTKNGYPVAPRD